MRNKRRIANLLLAIVLLFTLTGCGSKGTNEDTGRKDAEKIIEDNVDNTVHNQEDSSSEEGAAKEKRTEYPVTITTYGSDGKELVTTYKKAPEKVLAVYQGSIETLLTLGLEERIVATAGLDNEVPDSLKAAFSKTNYLDEFTPSLETVTMLEPDMILSWGSLFKEKTLGAASAWIEKGTNTYINSNARPATGEVSYDRTLENEYKDILNLGVIFDVQDKAESIVKDMKDTVEAVTEVASKQEKKPTVLILESYDSTFTNYGASSLGGDMVTALGGKLAKEDGSDLGKEDIIALNPDVIFVVYMPYEGDDAEKLKQEKLDVFLKDKSLASLSAVQNNRVVPIMLSEMYASTTRTKDGIVTFAQGLYHNIEIK
ncbi:ABC transporter substrate-binding protein [Anaerocolumna jejuensis]|uniref:ABC transporter substrate-binding protein n=1 Tax=Anaerocolumna jejuensis TaxID=259063 RepID=UPI003F7BB9B4